jgi:hypothetical protein
MKLSDIHGEVIIRWADGRESVYGELDLKMTAVDGAIVVYPEGHVHLFAPVDSQLVPGVEACSCGASRMPLPSAEEDMIHFRREEDIRAEERERVAKDLEDFRWAGGSYGQDVRRRTGWTSAAEHVRRLSWP